LESLPDSRLICGLENAVGKAHLWDILTQEVAASMSEQLHIEFPFGFHLPNWYCPVCGQSTLPQLDDEKEEPKCRHVDWVYADDSGDFIFLRKSLADWLDRKMQEDDEVDALEELRKHWNGGAKVEFVITTGGMACGPVWSTFTVALDLAAEDDG
jgi:hypothetical protein